MAVFERTYSHCMGMYASSDGRTLWVSSRYQLWRFEQAPAAVVPYRPVEGAVTDGDDAQAVPQWTTRGYDVAYVPRAGFTTGHLDVHDLAVDAGGRVIFVNTLFGCLATLSERASFQPLWRPPFLSALVPEDRCHLNGLATRDGRAAFVTVVSRSDVAHGWRDSRSRIRLKPRRPARLRKFQSASRGRAGRLTDNSRRFVASPWFVIGYMCKRAMVPVGLEITRTFSIPTPGKGYLGARWNGALIEFRRELASH